MAYVSMFSSGFNLPLPYRLSMQSDSVLDKIVALHSMTNEVRSSGTSRFEIISRDDWSQRSAELRQASFASAELVITQKHYCQPQFQRDLLLNVAGSSQQPIHVQGVP